MRAPSLQQGLGVLVLAASALWLLRSNLPNGPRLGAGEASARRAAPPSEPAAAAVPPSLPPVLPAPSLAAPSPAPPRDEAALMTELRRVKDDNPALAEQLAREGNRLYPNSAQAPERASILIHALASEGRPTEARGEAEDMVNRYPYSEWVREIEAFTGAHRHGNVHFTDNGQLAVD